ncbi:MAG: hypothetical protein LKJ86_07550 [Oscillibacter sp.]|jgi:putative membrane fusion protein|nr:hypothetical protein [Oscillibacter sp.]
MKSSSLGTKILMAVVCLVVLTYFGIQGYRYFSDPVTSTVAYNYRVEDSITVTGWVVRDEQVLPDNTSGLLRLSRKEGEKVSRGGEIARVYADQSSLDCQSEIDTVRSQIDQLQYAQEASAGSELSLKLDSQIIDQILSLRGDLAADHLDAADSHISDLRSLVLKRDYTYSDADDLSTQLEDLQSQLKSLKSQAAASTSTVRASESGIYSAVVDGYETVLTPDTLSTLTPSALSKIAADGSLKSDVGKLVLGHTWYYAASLSATDADNLSAGESVTLRFAKGDGRELTVTVDSLSKEENGRVVVVFSSSQYLSELTLLRQQSADIIKNTVFGIRVPENALRVNDDGQTGLYCMVGMTAKFKPVRVLYTGSGFALVEAVSDKDKTVLRSGDEVLVTARMLHDGDVINES